MRSRDVIKALWYRLIDNDPAVSVLTFPRFADKLLVVIEDVARVVKMPIKENEPAVNVVVASVSTFPTFADRVLVVREEARRTVKFPIGADNDATVNIICATLAKKLPEVNVATVS